MILYGVDSPTKATACKSGQITQPAHEHRASQADLEEACGTKQWWRARTAQRHPVLVVTLVVTGLT